jgi:alkylhydroperoxidase family enzyme
MLKVDPEWIELAAGSIAEIPDPKLREMMLFALKCSRAPRSVTSSDHARLQSFGLSEKEILEIISMAGLAVYANIVADATGMEADEMFADYAPAAT